MVVMAVVDLCSCPERALCVRLRASWLRPVSFLGESGPELATVRRRQGTTPQARSTRLLIQAIGFCGPCQPGFCASQYVPASGRCGTKMVGVPIEEVAANL